MAFQSHDSQKPVIAKFDRDHASSDVGAVLLKACDEKLKLSTTLALQPTVSRFVNAACQGDLLRLSEALAGAVIAHESLRRLACTEALISESDLLDGVIGAL